MSQIKEDDSKTTVSDPIIENLAVQQGRFSSVLDKILENKDDKLAIVFDKIISKEDGSSEIKSQTELPKLYIRKFNGKSFKCSSSHDNSHFAVGFHQLNEIDKFRYLQSCFKGSAQRAINFLPTQDLSYQKVIKK